MIYSYKCECDCVAEIGRSISEGPPDSILCVQCGKPMQRDWQADAPIINTSTCVDPDFIPEKFRVQREHAPRSANAEETKFQRHINQKRKEIADGGNRRSMRQTHAVPADLYHGKIKQTGDKNYWMDPKNLSRHKNCKVSK